MAPIRTSRAALACLSLILLTQAGSAVPVTGGASDASGPLPFAAPDQPAAGPLDRVTTSTARPQNPLDVLRPDEAEIARLREGLDALARGDIAGAKAIAEALPDSALDRHILQWAMAVSGEPAFGARDIAAAMTELAGWPGMTAARRNLERAVYREEPAPERVLALLGQTRPDTYEGTMALARAHVAMGDTDAALAVIRPLWRTARLQARQETTILKEFGGLIPDADHRYRMERMMYRDRIASAERLATRLGAEDLVKAWAAVIRGARNAGALLDAVPKEQRSAGYTMAKAQHLRRAGKFAEAAALVRQAPRDTEALVDPDSWWIERRVLSRELLDIGDVRGAYEIAAGHSAESPVHTVDAEFHAGWYALRGLRDAKLAAGHFERMAEVAEGPISLARAYYWLGRTAAEGGPGKAEDMFAKAAQFGTTFYGQLAAAKMGKTAIEIVAPAPSHEDQTNFASREAVRAVARIEAAGHRQRADLLYRELASEMKSPAELALLVGRVQERGDHFLALRMGKAAAGGGLDLGALSHPVGAIPAEARIDGAGQALAYAIARQESEFNVSAVSGAGARGLLQLLPGTARDMARQTGLPYSEARLTTDAAYNATLGAAYLSDQLSRFDGSYILTFIGYNAGPRRARDWVARYGDPRGRDIDFVVDWLERIPFTETRGYVQRVMENYQVYKMRLTGKVDIVGDLTQGRR